jgi:hypothetical protein
VRCSCMDALTIKASLSVITRHKQQGVQPGLTLRRILRFLSVNDPEEFALILKLKEAFEAEMPQIKVLEAVRATMEFMAKAERV